MKNIQNIILNVLLLQFIRIATVMSFITCK